MTGAGTKQDVEERTTSSLAWTEAVCFVLLVTFLGSTYLLCSGLYKRGKHDAENLAVALRHYARQVVTVADIETRYVADYVSQSGDFVAVVTAKATHEVLSSVKDSLPEGSAAIIVDPSGTVVASSEQYPATPVDLSDRDWLHAHRDEDVHFRVSASLISRVTHRKIFVITRSILAADDRFLGVVNIGIPSDALVGRDALPDFGPGTVLTLMKSDGGVLAQNDFPDELVGTSLSPWRGTDAEIKLVTERAADGRVSIEARVPETHYSLVALASVPLSGVLWPGVLMGMIGLPLVALMMFGTIKLNWRLAGQTERLEATSVRLRTVLESAHLGAWHIDLRTGESVMTERWAAIVGHDPSEIRHSTDEWEARLHPDEKPKVMQLVKEVYDGRLPYLHVEHRMRHKNGDWVWVLNSGCVVERGPDGSPLIITGTLLDITERKNVERRLRLLMRELDHRAKNLLAVVYSLIHMTRADSVAQFRTSLLGRVKALGDAHTLLSQAGWDGVNLEALILRETAAYNRSETGDADTVSLSGPAVLVSAASAQAIAVVVHELMTNAAKYGALSVPSGKVNIVWSVEGEEEAVFKLSWRETDGPTISEPTWKGFGTSLLTAMVREQLDGQIEMVWSPQGLRADIVAPFASVRFVARRDDPDRQLPSVA